MKNLTFVIFLVFFCTSAFPCKQLTGTWRNCSVVSPRLNSFEEAVFRTYLKPYTLKFSVLDSGHIKSVGSYKKIFGDIEVIHDDYIPMNSYTNLYWNNVPNMSAGPILKVFYKCKNNSLEESMEWINLDRSNYTDEEVSKNHKFIRSKYLINDGKFIRYIYSKQFIHDQYSTLATMTCEK